METSVTFCPQQAEADSIRDFSIDTFTTVTAVGETRWNRLVPEANLLIQYDYLQLLETVQGQAMEFRYCIVNKGDTAIGAMYFQVVHFDAAQLINYFPEGNSLFLKGARSVSESILNSIQAKLLVTGNVFMTGENGLYFSPDVDLATRAKILRKTVNGIFKGDGSIKAVLISDMYAPKTDFDKSFPQHGYHEITVESDMSVTIRDDWHTMDDYLKSLSSKYRVRAKRVFTLCNEANVYRKELGKDDIELHAADLYRLYKQVMQGADFRLAELSKDYFTAQMQQLPDNYRVYAYFKDGEMIGFISAFHIGRKVEVHYTGMKHDISKPIHLYQHMMYDMIEYGITHQAKKLHFGRTAPEIKSTIGAVPSPMYGYLKHRNPVFNFSLVGPYTRNLKPKDYALRNPFKLSAND